MTRQKLHKIYSLICTVTILTMAFSPIAPVLATPAPNPDPTISVDQINGQPKPFNFVCPTNPLFSPVTISGSGTGSTGQGSGSGNIEQYAVQIDWGDGQVTNGLGTFTPSSGKGPFSYVFSAGPHTYASGSSYTIKARLYHQNPPGNDNQADTVVSIPVCVVVNPATLTVVKHVVNTDGGTLSAADFDLYVKIDGQNVNNSPAIGSESGTVYTLMPGDYVVSEDPITNYIGSISGDCDTQGNITLTSDQIKTCTITNIYGAQCNPGATDSCSTGLFGICASGTKTCNQSGFWGSCVADTQPGAVSEVCGNQQDDDCDGYTDNNDTDCQECTPQDTQSCDSGLLGECAAGTKTCGGDGFWDDCVPTNYPISEICDNLDNDCDGITDEFLISSTTCGLGACTGNTGFETCEAGVWGNDTCNPLEGATQETCDGSVDENCDGSVDEYCDCTNGDTMPCGQTDIGECSYGTQTCSGGVWGQCVGAINPVDEVCDGLDNDCDSSTDEGELWINLGQSCTSGVGACQTSGTYICNSQNPSGATICSATPGQPSEVEDCNNQIDDDCDGATDAQDTDCQECTPQAVRECSTGQSGICSAGIQTCQGTGFWGECVQNNQATTEICDNQLDDDCDGATDAADTNCQACTPQATQACSTGLLGICTVGTETCGQNGFWGSCVQTNQATNEICDNQLDDDCDGATDAEDTDCQECTPQATTSCALDLPGICSAGTRTCGETGFWGECVQNNQATTEICTNQLDDDCDGYTDSYDSNCEVVGPQCGDQVCESGESCSNCSQDCGQCPAPPGGGGGGGGGPIGLYIHTVSIASGSTPLSVLITWFTNLSATSRVLYDTAPHSVLGQAPNYGYQWSTATEDQSPKVTYHDVLIENLISGVHYYFRPVSASSPEIYGSEIDFVIPEQISGPGEPTTPATPPTPPTPQPPQETPTPPTPPAAGGTTGGQAPTGGEGVTFTAPETGPTGQVLGEEAAVEPTPTLSSEEEATPSTEEVATTTAAAACGATGWCCNIWCIIIIILILLILFYLYIRSREKKKE